MKLPYIPTDAPFSGDQRAWLAGFLAGLHSRSVMGGATDAAPAGAPVQAKPLDILYGTQTGNAESLANDAAEHAKRIGYTPRIAELDAVEMDQLAQMQNLIVVVSTYGEGEMPDNAEQFWTALSASTAPRLESLKFGVLALGDTSYEHFCQAGKLIDTRLEQLGATRLGPRVDCDVDYDDVAAAWIAETIPEAGPAAEVAAIAPPPKPEKSGYSRKNPFNAAVVDNRVLSGEGSAKEIRHIAFDLGDSGLDYEAGDALGVMPVNAPDLVDRLLDRLGADAETPVDGHDAPLGALLRHRLEIMTPPRELIRALEPLLGHDEFSHVVRNGDKQALEAFLWGRDTLDLLNLNADLKFDVDEFVGWLKPLQHRAYSISSSPKAHPGEVHLTVAAVRWMRDERMHKGVCSTFLADQAPEGATAGVFMSANKNFRIPGDDDAPMVMVGPGTGVAPFRAFLEERRERNANGPNWLFFGDQHRAQDFIYEDEISAMRDSGLLTRLDLAFSRDQSEKIYVQHRMIEHGEALFAMIEGGGSFYVCGDATRMAKDVDDALHTVIATHGGFAPEAAAEYVNRLKREKRYLRDVY